MVGMTHGGTPPDVETLQAVADLLVAAEQHGAGVTFEPDTVGWNVGYPQGRVPGDLTTSYDFQTAAGVSGEWSQGKSGAMARRRVL